MRPTRDQWAMALVVETAKRSTCLRRAVGCVLLNKRGHVLATGYNGVASGMSHCNEVTNIPTLFGPTYESEFGSQFHNNVVEHRNACKGAQSPSGMNLDGCEAIHAEQNALLQCRDVYEIRSCYVSCTPCITCMKLLLNTSCVNIFYKTEYAHKEANDLWLRSGRNLKLINGD